MNTRREPDKNSLERIGARVRQRALTGSEASTVGFTLVVFIFAGAGLGYLLDTYLETSYWIAIGTLFGAAVGFREMFRLTRKLTRSSALEDDEPTRSLSQPGLNEDSISPNVSPSTTSARMTPESAAKEEKISRPRIFSVPPPPQASFDKPGVGQNTPATSELVESQEELIERLLDEDRANGEGENEEQTK